MDFESLYELAGRGPPAPDTKPDPESPAPAEAVAAGEPDPDLHGFTLRELVAQAEPDERAALVENRKAQEAFALALREAEEKAKGVRPARYTAVAFCAGCGVVWLPPTWYTTGLYAELDIPKAPGCPWCENRLQGKPRPTPYPLQPAHHDPKQNGPWPYSEHCRPLVWQGKDERSETTGDSKHDTSER